MKKRTTVLLTGLAMTLLPMVAAPSAQAVCGEVGGPYVNANGCLMPGEGAAIAGSIVAADAWDEARQRWDIPAITARVLASQRRRRFVDAALSQGRRTSWDHQPFVDASQQYMRNHIDLDDLERKARYPQPCQNQ